MFYTSWSRRGYHIASKLNQTKEPYLDRFRLNEYNIRCIILPWRGKMNKFITVSQIAEKWGVTERYVQILCKQRRVDGVVKFGNSWAIPEDAERPQKLKSGFKGRRE